MQQASRDRGRKFRGVYLKTIDDAWQIVQKLPSVAGNNRGSSEKWEEDLEYGDIESRARKLEEAFEARYMGVVG